MLQLRLTSPFRQASVFQKVALVRCYRVLTCAASPSLRNVLCMIICVHRICCLQGGLAVVGLEFWPTSALKKCWRSAQTLGSLRDSIFPCHRCPPTYHFNRPLSTWSLAECGGAAWPAGCTRRIFYQHARHGHRNAAEPGGLGGGGATDVRCVCECASSHMSPVQARVPLAPHLLAVGIKGSGLCAPADTGRPPCRG